MTEAAHLVCTNPLPPRPRKPGSVGLPAGPEVTVVDEAGQPVPSGGTGEVVIRGPNVMRGYERNPDADAAAFRDGWFRTGDLGFLDDDGYVHLTGRLKELINRGGQKVAPREVDEVLNDYPAVAQAVAFAMPDAQLGEDVGAAVVLRDGMSATEKDLRAYAATRLAAYKVPRRIVLVGSIPKDAAGKLRRADLAAQLGVAETSSRAPPGDIEEPQVEPRTPAEAALARVWSEVLRVDRVGVRDGFLDLGGDSILATQILARMRDVFGVEVPFTTFFDVLTIEGLAAEVEEARRRDGKPPFAA